jgi:DNA invertase Pin-like site-specific DNA recombinase
MLDTCLYLRKSRTDEELEKELGEKSTLERHKKSLLKLAKDKNLNITKIHEELVSGDELFFRPAMLEMLKEVEQNKYKAVLVMDIQRLGRGDTEEQGLIIKTFKKADVKIITPSKTYNLSDEFDEEYIEFEAFMGRKEYRMINRRMQGGRIRSVQEGNYIATRPPYGYQIDDRGKLGRTLIPYPEQAEVIRMIYDWYVNKGMGCSKIAQGLNDLGIRSYNGGKWERTTITSYLKNQTYIGKVVWKKKCIRKSKTPGKKKDAFTRSREDWIISNGKHEPIVEENIFNEAQKILEGKYHAPYQLINGITNPLAGLIVCGICGSKMKRRPHGDRAAHIICENKCGTKSNKFITLENQVLEFLKGYMKELETELYESKDANENLEILSLAQNLDSLEKELRNLNKQKLTLHDLLEQGVYDINTFIERSNYISDKVEYINKCSISTNQALEAERNKKTNSQYLDELKSVIDLYYKTDDANRKNLLLKKVLAKVVYYKHKVNKNDEFKIELFPKL